MNQKQTSKDRLPDRFPERVYTLNEVQKARTLIEKGYKHRIRIKGSPSFKIKTQEAVKLIRSAGYYDFLRTYIRSIREIDGLSQLRESEASIWANIYAVNDPVDAACFFIQKAWQMKRYVEGKIYYGPQGETLAAEERVRFIKKLTSCTSDLKIKAKCLERLKLLEDSRFL